MDLFENIVDIIITDLFNEKEENKHFWSCVFKDDDHPFFYLLHYYIEDEVLDKNDYTFLDILKKDEVIHAHVTTFKSSLLNFLKKEIDTRSAYMWLNVKDNSNIKEDLISPCSIILSAISKILHIGLSITKKTGNFYFFPENDLYKTGKPLAIIYNPQTLFFEKKIQKTKINSSPKQTFKFQKKPIKRKKIIDCSSESEDESSITSEKKEAYLESNAERSPSINHDLDLSSDSDTEENKSNFKEHSVKKSKKISLNVSDDVCDLKGFPVNSSLFQDCSTIQENLQTFIEISDRIKKHVLLLKENMYPEKISTCLCCPVHCSNGLLKSTKGKRGPKKKKEKKTDRE